MLSKLQWLSTDTKAGKARTAMLCVLALTMIVGFASTASAQFTTTINFDDVVLPPPNAWTPAPPAVNPAAIPDGYAGFDWTNGVSIGQHDPQNILGNCVVSPVKCGINNQARTLGMKALWDDFTLDQAMVTGINRDGLNVEFRGYLDGNLQWTETIVVNALAPTLFTPLSNAVIDEQQVDSYGGSMNVGSNIDSQKFGWDDVQVSFVPEPSTALLFGLGLGGISALRRRRE